MPLRSPKNPRDGFESQLNFVNRIGKMGHNDVLNDDALCTVGGTATIKGFTPLASPKPDSIISRFFNANEGVSPTEFREK